jgi:P27 family predicted phage terminase small subunit
MARPRKPSHLKIVSGTAQKCRMNENEPVAPKGAPEAPLWLSSRAVELFHGICATIDKMGYLSTADGHVIALAASRLEEVEITTAMIEDGGRTYISAATYDDEGRVLSQMMRSSPAVGQRNDAMRHAQALLSDCGLTPSARSKVSAGKKTDDNPFKALMGGG